MSAIQDIVARTIWAEARSEGLDGMAAVANVIQNRAENPGWWGRDLESVCLHPWQFSCWNVSDPQRSVIRAVDSDNPLFRDALMLQEALKAGKLRDRTGGADHYYADYIAAPKWAQGRYPTVVIGRHRFYRIGLKG